VDRRVIRFRADAQRRPETEREREREGRKREGEKKGSGPGVSTHQTWSSRMSECGRTNIRIRDRYKEREREGGYCLLTRERIFANDFRKLVRNRISPALRSIREILRAIYAQRHNELHPLSLSLSLSLLTSSLRYFPWKQYNIFVSQTVLHVIME